jgi:hypothetical protein
LPLGLNVACTGNFVCFKTTTKPERLGVILKFKSYHTDR